MCHAVIEDSMLFGAAGANVIALISARVISAVFITFVLSRLVKKEVTEDESSK